MTYITQTRRVSLPYVPYGAPGIRDYLLAALHRIASDRLTIFLALLLATVTVLSAQALHPLDNFVNAYPRFDSDLFRRFLVYWPDTVASRAVALPVLGLVVLYLALLSRSWRPIVIGGGAVFTMICLVLAIKVVVSRSHPRTGDPSFFVDFGSNFSYPSGHGANAVLIYGIALYLIMRYRAVSPPVAARLGLVIAMIAMLQTGVSVYLHFHWFTDLAAGMVAGALVLRMTILVDRMIPEGWTVGWWPFPPVEACRCVRRSPTPGREGLQGDRGRVVRGTPSVRAATQRARPLPSRPTRVRAQRPPRGGATYRF